MKDVSGNGNTPPNKSPSIPGPAARGIAEIEAEAGRVLHGYARSGFFNACLMMKETGIVGLGIWLEFVRQNRYTGNQRIVSDLMIERLEAELMQGSAMI